MLPYIVGLVAAMVLTLFGVSTVKFYDLEPKTWLQQIASGLIYSTHVRLTIPSTPAYSTPAPSAALLTSATPQPNVSNMTVWPTFEDYNVLNTSLLTNTIVTPMHTPSTLSAFKVVFICYLLLLTMMLSPLGLYFPLVRQYRVRLLSIASEKALVAVSGYRYLLQVTCSITVVALNTCLRKAVDHLSYWLKPHKKVVQEEADPSSPGSPCHSVENELTEIKRELSDCKDELSQSKQGKKQSDQKIKELQEVAKESKKQSDQEIKKLQKDMKDFKKRTVVDVIAAVIFKHDVLQDSYDHLGMHVEKLQRTNREHEEYNGLWLLEKDTNTTFVNTNRMLVDENTGLENHTEADGAAEVTAELETKFKEVLDTEKAKTKRSAEKVSSLEKELHDERTSTKQTQRLVREAHQKEIYTKDNEIKKLNEQYKDLERVTTKEVSTKNDQLRSVESKFEDLSKFHAEQVEGLGRKAHNSRRLHSRLQKRIFCRDKTCRNLQRKSDAAESRAAALQQDLVVSKGENVDLRASLQEHQAKLVISATNSLRMRKVAEGLWTQLRGPRPTQIAFEEQIVLLKGANGVSASDIPATASAASPNDVIDIGPDIMPSNEQILDKIPQPDEISLTAIQRGGAAEADKDFTLIPPQEASDARSNGESSELSDSVLSSSSMGNNGDDCFPQRPMDRMTMDQEIVSGPPSSLEAVSLGASNSNDGCTPTSSSTSVADSSGTPRKAQSNDDANVSSPLISAESEGGCTKISNGDEAQRTPLGDDSDLANADISNTPVIANKSDSAAIPLNVSSTSNSDYRAGPSKSSISQTEHQAAITVAESGSNTGAASSSLVAPDPAESIKKETLDGDEELYDFHGNGKYIDTNSPVTPNTSSPAADAAAEGEKKDVDSLCRDDSDRDGEFDGGFDLSEEISKGKGNGQTLPPSAKSVTAAHPNVGPSFDTQPPTSSTGTQSQDEQDSHMADEEEEDKMDEFDGSPEISPGSEYDAEMGEATDDYGSAAGRPYFHHATPGPSTVPAVDQEIDMGEAQDWQLGNPSRTSPREAVTAASFPDPWPATPALTPTALQEKKLDTSRLAHPKLNQLSPARASSSAAKSTESSSSPFSPFKPKSKTGSQATPPKTMSFDPALSPFTTNTPAWTPIGPALSTSGSPDFKFSPASNSSPFSPFKPKLKTGSQATPPNVISSNPALPPFTTKTPAWTPIGPGLSSSGPPNVMFSPRSRTSSSPLSLGTPSSPYYLPGLSVPCTALPSSPLAGLNSSPLPSSHPKSASPGPSALRRSPSALPTTSLVAGGYDSGSESDEDEPLRPPLKLPARKPVRAPVKLPAPKPLNYSLGFGNSLSNFDTAPPPGGAYALPKTSAPANPAPVRQPAASQSKNKRSIEDTVSSGTQKAEISSSNDGSSSAPNVENGGNTTNTATNHAFTERTTGAFSSLLDFMDYKEETVTLTNGMQRQVRNPKSRHFQRLGL